MALVGFALFLLPLPVFLLLHAWHRVPPSLVALSWLPMGAGIGCMLASVRLAIQWRQQLETILSTGDCRGIGLVLEAMHAYDRWSLSSWVGEAERQTQRSVCLHYTNVLLTLLPRLQREEFALLTTDQIDIMGKSLYRTDTSLVLALLETLARHGDKRAMRTVQNFVRDSRFGTCNEQVRQAVQECLLALEERSREQTAPLVLLRASAASQWEPENLLRAAQSGVETPSEELLRASVTRETDGWDV